MCEESALFPRLVNEACRAANRDSSYIFEQYEISVAVQRTKSATTTEYGSRRIPALSLVSRLLRTSLLQSMSLVESAQ